MEHLDLDKNGEINYSEFLAATIDRKYLYRDQNALAIFNHFDTKNEGKITTESLRKAFRRGKSFVVNFWWKALFNTKYFLCIGSKSFHEDELKEKEEIDFNEFKDLLSHII